MSDSFDNIKKIWAEESKGFGDTFAKITKTIGIEPCPECEERRISWNEKLAYKKKSKKKSANSSKQNKG